MTRGVIYLKRLPIGFHEPEMRSYFSQFGAVTRLKLFRNQKTAKSRGFGYVEFFHEEVAKIAASTMNNYLLGNQIVKCEVIPREKVHPGMFRNAQCWIKPYENQKATRKKHARIRTDEEILEMRQGIRQMLEKSNAKLRKKGIDYQFKIPDEHLYVKRSDDTST